MTNEQKEKLKTLLADKDFAETLLKQESETDVQAYLKENGVDLDMEDIAALHQGLDMYCDGDGSLNEDDLEAVVGGSVFSDIADVLDGFGDVFKGFAKIFSVKW